ncbi:PREDICTED: uncharacterized protein LOC104724741 [Camelina sativa]|uniref:Uncharacterized protein LOC104724741 n=1 Tax=Camelina sativa TaxID=90675 RepID=A0ABM1QLX6_CAMSA|nr:PREDICTED: uncharacterized protein LOC104724741 [Camelina sativa]XP_019087765.1 PREDICTED: uncharacterized protein LOC104724741 [Camelina sativa]
MADVVKMGIASLKESVRKGPVKDDCHLRERPDESAARRDESTSVSNQNLHESFSYFSNSLSEFGAGRIQRRGSALVSNQNLWDNRVTHPLSTSYDAKREEEFLKFTPEFILKVHIDDVATREDQLRESTSLSNQNFHDEDNGGSRLLCDKYNNKNDETYQEQRRSFEHNQTEGLSASMDTNLQQLSIENDKPETSVKGLQHVQCGSFGSGMNGSAQPSSLPSGLLNDDDSEDISGSVVSPLSLQMQNINTIPTVRQQAYTKETDPQASPLNQSMPTTSSLDPRLSVSMTEPTQNDTYDMSPSAFHKHGGRNNNSYHLRSSTVPLSHYSNSVLSPSAVAVPSAHSSTNGFGMSSDTAANSMCGYEDVLSSEFSNHLATLQHQNGTSNMWTPQGLNDSGNSLFSGPQDQQS